MQRLTRWLNKLVKCTALYLAVSTAPPAMAQHVQTCTLQQAFDAAIRRYPVSRQKEAIRQGEQLIIRNVRTGYLPRLSINAQASYQSDVTRLNIPVPGVKVPVLSKDQYKAYADVSQPLYDGGQVREQIHVQQLSSAVEQNKADVELYNLKSRINQLYFAILYQQELQHQTNLLLNDIRIGISKITPQVENGTVLRSNLLLLEAQRLQTAQRSIEIRNTKKGLLNALSVLMQTSLSDSVLLLKPDIAVSKNATSARPELALYNTQVKLLATQKKSADARNHPVLSAFVQGGFGRPALNFLSNEFKAYYTGGLRLSWSLQGLYTAKQNNKLLEIQQRSVGLQKEAFTINTEAQLGQLATDIDRCTELVESDNAIIEVRKKISDAAKAQLENAVITTNDYLKEINAEDIARQLLIIHQLQLIQAKADYALTTGNL